MFAKLILALAAFVAAAQAGLVPAAVAYTATPQAISPFSYSANLVQRNLAAPFAYAAHPLAYSAPLAYAAHPAAPIAYSAPLHAPLLFK
ncbi:cuticle protein 38-like [Cloeon dipterum]|uniref:Uncharacterized protein n=1 Tax=Cloeon dipterum TaxID=197152 RepID=A0A8S1D4L0_9INSE|nr:Hypothetical predicted protein [Cloeon dipterum]